MLTNKQGNLLNTYEKDYVIFDLETTGISSNYDEVVEISAVKVQDGKVVDEFSHLVNPGRPIPFQASQVNGITDSMVAKAPYFDEVLEGFISFIGEDPLVGHNIHSFDMKFIYRDCLKFFGKVPGNDYIDTLKLAKGCLPQLSHHRLTDLASYYGISTEGAHRALNDCRMNQRVFEALAKEPLFGQMSGGKRRQAASSTKSATANSNGTKTATTKSTGTKTATAKSTVAKTATTKSVTATITMSTDQKSSSKRMGHVSKEEMDECIDILFGGSGVHGVGNRRDEEPTRRSTTQGGKSKSCPFCGSDLKKRNGRYGDFLGCTGFPNCRYTENV